VSPSPLSTEHGYFLALLFSSFFPPKEGRGSVYETASMDQIEPRRHPIVSPSPPVSTADSKEGLVEDDGRQGTSATGQQGCGFMSSRTSLARAVALTTIVMCCVLVIALTPVAYIAIVSMEDACVTPACIEAAHTIMQNMDADADPCEDFYQYACGGFVRRVSDRHDRTCFSS